MQTKNRFSPSSLIDFRVVEIDNSNLLSSSIGDVAKWSQSDKRTVMNISSTSSRMILTAQHCQQFHFITQTIWWKFIEFIVRNYSCTTFDSHLL